MTGALRVGRLLNADILELVLFGPSRSSEVGGGSITIKRSKAGALLKQVQSKGILFTARVIEGDQVDIQTTRAEVVRGKRHHWCRLRNRDRGIPQQAGNSQKRHREAAGEGYEVSRRIIKV